MAPPPSSTAASSLVGLFVVVYGVCVVAVIVYVLRLLSRFVSAHERVASALEVVARKSQEAGKQ